MVIATQNPVEYEGTFPLPEAQLDRFAVRVTIGYPPPGDEAEMLLDVAADDPVERVAPVTDRDGILAARATVARVHTEPVLAQYVVALVAVTRRDAPRPARRQPAGRPGPAARRQGPGAAGGPRLRAARGRARAGRDRAVAPPDPDPRRARPGHAGGGRRGDALDAVPVPL